MHPLLKEILDNQKKSVTLKFKLYNKLNQVYGGISKRTLMCITAGPGIGKTTFIKNLLLDLIANNEDKEIHILYYALEESPENFKYSLLAILAMKFDNFLINTRELLGIDKLSSATKKYLETSNILEITEKYTRNIHVISTLYDPDAIIKDIESYVDKHWEVTVNEHFDKVYNIPDNVIVFPIVDHINLLYKERMSRKEVIDYFVEEKLHKTVNKDMGMPAIVVQQQALEAEGLESLKKRGAKPSLASLGDSRTPSRTYHYVLGLYKPYKYDINQYNNITVTEDTIFVLPLKVRDFKPYEIAMEFRDKSRFLVQL